MDLTKIPPIFGIPLRRTSSVSSNRIMEGSAYRGAVSDLKWCSSILIGMREGEYVSTSRSNRSINAFNCSLGPIRIQNVRELLFMKIGDWLFFSQSSDL